jgi:hypothetical protein
MASLAEIRAQYPDYADISDAELAEKLHGKFYSDMSREEFNAKVGFTPKGVSEDVARQGVGGISKGIVDTALGLPYSALRHVLDTEGGVSIPGVGKASLGNLGVKLPAFEDMDIYKPWTKQPKAETDAGRYAGSAGEAIGASVVPAGAVMQKAKQIGTVAPAVPTLADKVLRPIAQNPGTTTAIDVVSATGSGTAKQAAEDAGGGPGTQTGAALLGGVASPFAVLAGAKALRQVAESIVDRFPKMLLSADGAEPVSAARERAIQMIADQATKAGISADDLEHRIAGLDWSRTFHTKGKAPDAMTLADLDESFARLLGSAVRQQPEAANTARGFLGARQTGAVPEKELHAGAGIPTRQPYDKDADPAGQRDRMLVALRKALRIDDTEHHGHAATANRTDDAIIEAQAEASKPEYDALRAAGESVDLRPVLQPKIEAWVVRANAAPETERRAIMRTLREFMDSDRLPVSNIDRFDKAKQFVDEDIKPYFEGVGDKKNKYLGRVITELKNDLLGAVDEIKTNGLGEQYKKARGVFAGHAEARRALRLGRESFADESDVGIDAFNELGDRELKNLFKRGYLGEVEKKSATMPVTHDMTKIFSTRKQQDLLAHIIERTETPKTRQVKIVDGAPAEFSDRPQRFGGFVGDEKKMRRTEEIVSGNSKTAERTADDAAFDTLHTIMDIFRNPSLVSIGRRSLELAASKAFGMRADTSAELAKMLLTADPARRQRIMQEVQARMGSTRFQRFSQIMQEYQRQAVTGTTGGVAASTEAETR